MPSQSRATHQKGEPIDPAIGANDTSTPPAYPSENNNLDLFIERNRIADPTNSNAAQVVSWFKEIGDRLLHAGNTALKANVTYHLLDSDLPQAFVSHQPREARIVISKGLLQTNIENEDMLAAVIGHELMHVHFRERIPAGDARFQNTKVDEYVADVASTAMWMIRAGYAPHQAVAFWDKIRERSSKPERQAETILRPWVAYTDVHGLDENRAQAINMVIANEIKARGTVPTAITHISGEMKAAVEASHHSSHIDKLIASHDYTMSTPHQRYTRLVKEIPPITHATAGRLEALESAFAQVLPNCSVTPEMIEQVYSALKENKLQAKCGILSLVVGQARKQGHRDAAPRELRELAKAISEFVRGRKDETIVQAALKISLFAREWNDIDPGAYLAKPPSFASPLRSDEEMPWERHLQLSRTLSERGRPEVLHALWMTGAYDVRLLNVAGEADLERLRNLPQFVSVSQANRAQLSPSGSWERNNASLNPLGELSIRQQYREFADAVAAERGHRKRVSTQQSVEELSGYSSLKSVPIELIAKSPEGVVSFFSEQLTHPDRVRPIGLLGSSTVRDTSEDSEDQDFDDSDRADRMLEMGPSASDDLTEHYSDAATLCKRFQEALNVEDPELRRLAIEGIRAFYLRSDGPCYRSLIGGHPEDRISTDDVCRHPITLYAAECTALSAEERVNFLRGLETRVSPGTWDKAFFSGYDFPNTREKLRHLQRIGAQQPAAREIGARLLISLFDKLRLGQGSILPILSEHKMLFPALRQADEDDRQPILDHIEAQSSWDVPLEQLADLFWVLEQGKLFPPAPNNLRENLRARLVQGIEVISDPVERQRVAERLLLSPVEEKIRASEVLGEPANDDIVENSRRQSMRAEMVNENATLLSLKDPVLRASVTDIWATAIREQMHAQYPTRYGGRDDNTARFIEIARPRLEAVAQTLRRRLPIQERREMLIALADQLELQETLAYLVRDRVAQVNRSGIMDAHEYLRSAEAAFEFLNQDRHRRDAVVRFLSQPLSITSLREFSARADIKREREIQAVTNTLNTMEAKYEAEVENAERKIETLNHVTDGDHKLSNKLDTIRPSLQASRDLMEAFDGDELYELITDHLSEPLPLNAEQRVRDLCGSEEDSRFFTHDQAHQVAKEAGKIVRSELGAELEAETLTFRQALREALSQLAKEEGSLALPALKRNALTQLVELRENDFIEKLEGAIEGARSSAHLRTTLEKALENLPASFEEERQQREADYEAEVDEVCSTIQRMKSDLQTQSLSVHHELAEFKSAVSNLIHRLPELVEGNNSPILMKLASMEASTILSEFLEEDWEGLVEEITTIEHSANTTLDRLDNDLRGNRERLNRMRSFAEAIHNHLPEIKRAPTPINAIVEQAGANVSSNEFDFTSGTEFVEEFSKLYPSERKRCSISATPLEEQQARQLYEIFWSQSAENRAIALKLLILPPEAEFQDRRSGKDSHFKGAFNFVADQIFPSGMKYGVEARKILQIFLEETDSSLRGFMLAALMAASEKVAGAPEEYSAGRRLSMILSMLGPAEKKLGQAINSHPSTPEDLRADTKSIKSMSDPLPRWDLLARVREALPKEYHDTSLPRLGKTLGAASYYIAVDCGESVLSILRPHARTLARTGLDRMHSIAIRLSNDSSMNKVAGPFIESIQQAREMIDLETDHQKGVLQQENARRRYEGLSIVVDGERFDFTTAAWKACGPEFRHQEKVHGAHFLDLTQEGQTHDPFVRRAALAHLTAELHNILSGDTFDHDRHGAQSKIQRGGTTHSIGLFDHGCMALQPPTEEEKRELASTLCDLVEGYLGG